MAFWMTGADGTKVLSLRQGGEQKGDESEAGMFQAPTGIVQPGV